MKLPDDPYVRELLPEFVETWIGDLENFDTILITKSNDELYRMAHTMKGSCYQFGLDDLGGMGIEMMGYAKASDWNNAKLLFAKILKRFTEIKEYLDKHFDEIQ